MKKDPILQKKKFFSATCSKKKNKDQIKINDIECFLHTSTKSNNDKYNKIREKIICSILNEDKEITKFLKDERWIKLKNSIICFLENLCKDKIKTIKCELKAGRKYNYDFKITINKKPYNIEFKFNIERVDDSPQFVSVIKPGKYFLLKYEEFFYDNYLSTIVDLTDFPKPDRDTYLKQINSTNPECMIPFKKLYKEKGDFYRKCKEISKQSIEHFLKKYTLQTDELSEYLKNTQKDKHYMCYKDGKFFYDSISKDTFNLCKNPTVKCPNLICNTKNKKKLEIKLRWKNGNGIAFPAFQIKRFIPNVNILKELLKINKIPLPKKKLKNDILSELDKNNIIY